jgi:hypothetical protein
MAMSTRKQPKEKNVFFYYSYPIKTNFSFSTISNSNKFSFIEEDFKIKYVKNWKICTLYGFFSIEKDVFGKTLFFKNLKSHYAKKTLYISLKSFSKFLKVTRILSWKSWNTVWKIWKIKRLKKSRAITPLVPKL